MFMEGTNQLDAGNYGADRKRKNRSVITMEQFGDRNRVHKFEPDMIEKRLPGEDLDRMGIENEDIDEKQGIWRPSQEEGTARPEDPPIYQPFRKAFHKTHDLLLGLGSDNDEFDASGFSQQLLAIGGEVKARSKAYKDRVRKFDSADDPVADVQDWYFDQMANLTQQVEQLQRDMLASYRDISGLGGDEDIGLNNQDFDAAILDSKSAVGKEIWRKRWQASVVRVNNILGSQWAKGKKKIREWMVDKKKARNGFFNNLFGWGPRKYPYMDESLLGDLDYIGSLAKGYKSAAKQYLRFLPEKFDVDANLDAPPLAVYAIRKGQNIDRGSVKPGELIKPLRQFEQDSWAELKKEPGMDPDDPFEVFIHTDNIRQIPEGLEHDNDAKEAIKEESISNRFQEIQDRIWWIRKNAPASMQRLEERLGAYITAGNEIKKRKLEPDDPVDTTYDYKDKDLTKMELILTSIETQARAEGGVADVGQVQVEVD